MQQRSPLTAASVQATLRTTPRTASGVSPARAAGCGWRGGSSLAWGPQELPPDPLAPLASLWPGGTGIVFLSLALGPQGRRARLRLHLLSSEVRGELSPGSAAPCLCPYVSSRSPILVMKPGGVGTSVTAGEPGGQLSPRASVHILSWPGQSEPGQGPWSPGPGPHLSSLQ